MSIGGPSALGTLLIHRLDSVLGTTLSQQTNLVSGARPDAVTQPNSPERPDAAQNQLHRQPRDGVDRATAQTEQQTKETINRAKVDARAAEILAARSAPSTSTTASAPTSLGLAARTILALLANFPDQMAAVQGKAPLLGTNPRASNAGGTTTTNTSQASHAAHATTVAQSASSALPAQLAQALAHALQRSGIFYESHLNNLAFGKQSVNQLQQEPQAQAGRGSQESSTAGQGKSTGATGPSPNANTPANSATTPVPVPGLDPQTHLLVRQQLEVLASQTFAWRGEAWPNAPMEWEINRREPSREDTGLPLEVDHWATRVAIQLPVLGNVQARLTLAGQQVVMQLIAPESSALLNQHTETLRNRFSAMGMQLSQLSVVPNAWEVAGGRQIPDNPTASIYQQQAKAENMPDAMDDRGPRHDK